MERPTVSVISLPVRSVDRAERSPPLLIFTTPLKAILPLASINKPPPLFTVTAWPMVMSPLPRFPRACRKRLPPPFSTKPPPARSMLPLATKKRSFPDVPKVHASAVVMFPSSAGFGTGVPTVVTVTLPEPKASSMTCQVSTDGLPMGKKG